MQLSWGSFDFDSDSVTLNWSEVALFNQAERIYAVRKTCDVYGYLLADGQAAVTAAMTALGNALRDQYRDLVFRQSGGSEAYHVLRNTGSISGVRVVRGPVFAESRGAEFATMRTFQFTAEAEYPVEGTNTLLVSYQETLDFGGGGPTYVHKPAINGPPQKQMVYPQVAYWATQRGQSVGYRAYPAPAAPIFPGALKENGRFSRGSPKRRGNGYQDFPVSWEYHFESVSPLAGIPNRWVG